MSLGFPATLQVEVLGRPVYWHGDTVCDEHMLAKDVDDDDDDDDYDYLYYSYYYT